MKIAKSRHWLLVKCFSCVALYLKALKSALIVHCLSVIQVKLSKYLCYSDSV